MLHTGRWLSVWPAALVLLVGCAAYERQPLELERHAEDWRIRDVNVDSVRAYAESLAQDERNTPYDPSDGLSLAEAEAVALVFNPQLRLIRAQAEVPLAGAREAGWWPDPEFEAEVLRFADRGTPTKARFDGPSLDGANTSAVGPGGFSMDGVEFTPPGYRRVEGDFIEDPWIVGASLSITIPISGRLAVEQDWAWAEYHASWRQILIAEWELLTRLRSAWLEWSTTCERIQVARKFLDQLGAVVERTERLAMGGELQPIDSRLILVELQRQRVVLQGLESDEELQRLELLALLGLAPGTPVELVPRVFLPEIRVSPEERCELVLRRDPRVLAARAEYEAAEQQLRLEVRKQYPDLTLGPSFSFEEGFSRWGVGFGLPIPLWNHNRQGVAEATAARDAARVRAETRIEQVLTELAHAEVRLRRAAQRRAMLVDDVALLVDRQLEEMRTLLAVGEADVLVLRDALSSAVGTKLEILDATLAEAQAGSVLQQMLVPRWITPSKAEAEEDDE